ncbi:MAG: sulfite exporter TauE/SafE family protein [Saprospiraceae bacterium]
MFYPIISGFLLGAAGSLHCIGMCGALAISLPVAQQSNFQKSISHLFYNSGRVVTYTIAGAIFGVIGNVFSLFKLQQMLTISAGILMFVLAVTYLYRVNIFNSNSKLTNWVKTKLAGFYNTPPSVLGYLAFGIFNGLLPCGLVYFALINAIAQGNYLHAAISMSGFGIGTIPAMISVGLLAQFSGAKFRSKLQKFTPYFIMALSIILILRGLNLGIPLISPILNQNGVSCCHH